MLELLVSFLMMFGVGFSRTDSGQIKIGQGGDAALMEVRSSKDFEPLGGEPALDAVIINDGTEGNSKD